MPVRYAHCPVVIKGTINRVDICRMDERIVSHPRLWSKQSVHFDPVHYLARLERKPGGLDYARPLEECNFSERFNAQPSINQPLIRELAHGEFVKERENVLLIGNSGTGKAHLPTALAPARRAPRRSSSAPLVGSQAT